MVFLVAGFLVFLILILIFVSWLYYKSNPSKNTVIEDRTETIRQSLIEPLMYFGPEQRKRVRVTLHDQECVVKFLACDNESLNRLKDKKFAGTIENLSIGGLKLTCTYDFPVRQNIMLNFDFLVKEVPFSVQGEVIKKEEFKDDNCYSYGIKFVNVSVQAEKMLTKTINQIIMEHRQKTS